jgi:hypothetical protein
VPFIIERRTEDNLSQHIQGAARWNKVNNKEGYFVFDPLSTTYREVEYESTNRQWYFIVQDTRTRNWVATQPVPQSLQLGRESICHSTVQSIDIDDSTEGHTQSPSKDQQHHSLAMTTQTTTGTSTMAAALTLAGTQAPTMTPIFRGFGSKPSASKGSGGNPPSRPPDGGGPPGPFGPPGGGAPHGGLGHARAGGGGGAKLGGNPPPEFNGDHSYANTFMNKFNLYRLANMEAEQKDQPMKRAALLLGIIKGPNVDDWVQLQTEEMLDKYNRGVSPHDPIYWDDLGQKFMQAFQDTGARERAEEKLHNLSWTPGDIDTFTAQFRTLADQAQYSLDAKPTITLFASKLPYKIVTVVLGRTLTQWL